jgi:hypothetical protein
LILWDDFRLDESRCHIPRSRRVTVEPSQCLTTLSFWRSPIPCGSFPGGESQLLPILDLHRIQRLSFCILISSTFSFSPISLNDIKEREHPVQYMHDDTLKADPACGSGHRVGAERNSVVQNAPESPLVCAAVDPTSRSRMRRPSHSDGPCVPTLSAVCRDGRSAPFTGGMFRSPTRGASRWRKVEIRVETGGD